MWMNLFSSKVIIRNNHLNYPEPTLIAAETHLISERGPFSLFWFSPIQLVRSEGKRLSRHCLLIERKKNWTFWGAFHHGTIIRTGITCKKIACYMRDSACRWLIAENIKIFRSYVKHFWIFPRETNRRMLIGLCK